jgi:hypothetical protein
MEYASPNEPQDQMTKSSADRGALTMPTKRSGTRRQRSFSHSPCDVTSAVQRAPHQAGVRPIEAVGYRKIYRSLAITISSLPDT